MTKTRYTTALGTHTSEREARRAAKAHAIATREIARVYLVAPRIGAVVVASYDGEGRSLSADNGRAIRRSIRARGGQ
jgi:hypothetical protein